MKFKKLTMLGFERTFNFPFKNNIPNYSERHFHEVSLYKRVFKFIRRYMFILAHGQKNLEVFSITAKDSRILWLNYSAPSIGDSLMDLSSRVLLEGKKVDLFTSSKNAHLYFDDDIFNEVYSELDEFKDKKYDIVIIDSYSTRSIRIKSKILPKTPYVGMFGFYNGPEVNRTLFSFNQMNNLLSNLLTDDELLSIAKNSINISENDKSLVDNLVPNYYVTIVLGGEWEYKTYSNWKSLINIIFSEHKNINIVLVGSNNAVNESHSVMKKFNNKQLTNLVSELSFNQTAEVIRRSQILICCDGGLMHAGKAVGVKIISLLARLDSEILNTPIDNVISLFDKNNVNNIRVEDLYEKFSASFKPY